MTEKELKLREDLDTMARISKQESAMLKAIESLGDKIRSLELDITLKDMRIKDLEKKLAEEERRK